MAERASAETIIGTGARIVGDVSFDGPAKIMGDIEGTIVTKSDLQIGAGANCKADIDAHRLAVDGSITGNGTARDSLELAANAKIEGDLITAVRASAGFPGAFEPVYMDGRTLGDGGIVNNLPVSAALLLGANRTIASDVTPPRQALYRNDENKGNWWERWVATVKLERRTPMVQMLFRATDIQQAMMVDIRAAIHPADLRIRMEMPQYRIESFSEFEAIVAEGEKAAERTLDLFYPTISRYTSSCCSLLTALEQSLTPPQIIILRGDKHALTEWENTLRYCSPRTLVFALPLELVGLPPSLSKTAPKNNAVNAWVCEGVKCLPEISDLRELLRICEIQGKIGFSQ